MSHQNQSPTRASGSTLPEPTTVLEGLGKDPRLIPQEATNYESPLALLDGLLTPNERFFVRSNGPGLGRHRP